MQVHVAHADITNLPVDAIVNPANSLGIMDRGIAGAIRSHGGDLIQTEIMRRAPIPVGAAMVTAGGALPAAHVIHAPTMEEPGMRIGAENIRRAARAALIAADINKFQVIAFPGMGTGDGGVTAEEASRAIAEEIRAHRKSFPETIYLVDVSADIVTAFDEALRNAVLTA
jgi:O-acetyl-ADP-ribose deacetylase (regulator of RNase III)